MHEITCPHCGRTERQLKIGRNSSGSQRYLCVWCQRKYTAHRMPQGYAPDIRLDAVRAATLYYRAFAAHFTHARMRMPM
jgi:transposase-like protein